MQYSLDDHPLFTTYSDPESGLKSYLLKHEIAPIQKHFYYTNAAVSADGRWLWVTCCYPPNQQKTLAAVSLNPADNCHYEHYPEIGYSSESPLLSPDSDGCWFCCGDSIYRFYQSTGTVEMIATLPKSVHNGRHIVRLATHLSLSADGTHLLLDLEIGDRCAVATCDIATGDIEIITWFMARHDHGQFSPDDPDLFLIAQDQLAHPISGDFLHHHLRTFTMRTDGSAYRCINQEFPCSPFKGACHEWWSKPGHIAFIDYETGVWEHNLKTSTNTLIWSGPLCHAHCDSTGRYFCADQDPYRWSERACQVKAFDKETKQTWLIDAGMPEPFGGRNPYHLDPHPQFSPDGNYIVYTSTQLQAATVALIPTTFFAD